MAPRTSGEHPISEVRDTGPAPRSARLSAVAWEVDGDIGLAQWVALGAKLGALGRGVGWWIGDWLTYGNANYGERYPRAARITGYDVQSLMNMAWVAARIEPSRRRTHLSWSHHAEVAALPPAEQDAWLSEAERERLSVRALRAGLQATKRTTPAQRTRRPTHPELEHDAGARCPHCGKRFAVDAPGSREHPT